MPKGKQDEQISAERARLIGDMLEDYVTLGRMQQRIIQRAAKSDLTRRQKVMLATSTSMATNALNRATGLLLKLTLGDEINPEEADFTEH
jgi:hypothetical protein